jgi:acetolactate synthase I/II/III large subunit
MDGRHGGRLLVDQLMVHGVKMAFTVPGESFLPVLDGFYDVRDRAKLVICRHEAGAANMAEAYGKLTNEPGICLVTRGPGATQASVGVHTAFQDSTPMILFVGDVGSDFRDREAFQEVNFEAMFSPLAKWAARIDDAERIPEYVARAFQVATSGRRGPVVLALPEDMLGKPTKARDAKPYRPMDVHPGAADMAQLREMLAKAKKPLVVLGGTGWTREACDAMRQFVEANDLPCGCAFRYQDLLDNNHSHYAGDVGIGINPKLAARVKEADVLLVVGARLGEMTTSGYTLLDSPVPRQGLVHVLADANEVGRVFQPVLGIAASPAAFAHAAAAMEPVANPAWKGSAQQAHEDYLAWSGRKKIPGRVQLWEVVDFLNQEAPDGIYCNGAGNFATWLHRFHRYTKFRTQLAPTSGAMGYGVPAAITASLVHPDRPAICFAGDGDFLMSGNELATAVQYGARPIIVILNNGMYGTIRMHQEKHYPGRISGTELANPDFAAYAKAFGCEGALVQETSQFPDAFRRAVKSGKPAVIELRIDPEAITPNTTLTQIREEALAKG